MPKKTGLAYVVAYYEEGETTPTYLVHGKNVRVLVVDENAPSDRVYEVTTRCSRKAVDGIIGGGKIGHKDDERHDALMARYNSAKEGQPHHLKVIDNE